MATSQFTLYKSSDTSAPTLTGASGGLLSVLDGCLVTGYGTKGGAGWTHPVATAGNIGSYLAGAGTAMSLVVNDASPNGTSLGKEAWATGWESVAGVGSPVGTGTGQFPTPAQLLTTGHTVIRKSLTNDGTVRNWVLFADNRTFYLFAATGDTAGMYFGFGFGDMYSFSGTDNYHAIIIGRSVENSTAASAEGFDLLNVIATPVVGNYMARSYTNTGASLNVGRHGDGVKGSASGFAGFVQYPNGEDTELYLSPIWVVETAAPSIRGLLRGIYEPLHTAANFTDGQTFSGAGAYAGKTFYALKTTPNSGVIFVETSNTVLTN